MEVDLVARLAFLVQGDTKLMAVDTFQMCPFHDQDIFGCRQQLKREAG